MAYLIGLNNGLLLASYKLERNITPEAEKILISDSKAKNYKKSYCYLVQKQRCLVNLGDIAKECFSSFHNNSKE